jgi:hypothetical protein
MSVASKFPSINPTLMLDFANTGILDPRITFTRATTATYFNALGVLTTAASGAARFDYNPSTLQPLGLLIEEARTNSIRNSTGGGAVVGTPGTDPTNWALSPAASGLTKEIVATGTENGIAYVDVRYYGTPSAGTNVTISFEAANNVAASSGQRWTQSTYVKLQAGSFTNTTTTLSLLGTNGTSGTESFASSTITSTPSDLQNCRLSVTGTLAQATTTHVQPRVRIGYTVGAAFDITLRLGLPQMELGAFATSVIPTTTTALTRNADVASMTGTNFSSWYNASQGTLLTQISAASGFNVANTFGRFAIIQDALGNNTVEMFFDGNANQAPRYRVRNGGTNQVIGNAAVAYTANTVLTSTLAYKENDFAGVSRGTVDLTDTSGLVPSSPTFLSVGSEGGSVNFLNGYIRRIAYYPTRLPNATLQALTA